MMVKVSSILLHFWCIQVFIHLCKFHASSQGHKWELNPRNLEGKGKLAHYGHPYRKINAPSFFQLRRGDLYTNLTNWGATLVSLALLDAKGHLADVLLGYDNIASYMNMSSSRPYFGALVGRVANRIKDGEFTLNGKTYQLPKNDGNNTLHGGLRGFDNVLWEVKEQRGFDMQNFI